MSISLDASTIVCPECGRNGARIGIANWRMCDKCKVTYCGGCFCNKLKYPSSCTRHQPRGKWLMSTASHGKACFK